MQVINLALFLTATTFLFYGSWRAAVALRLRGVTEVAVATLVLGLTGVIMVSITVGWALRSYTAIPLALGSLAWGLAGLWWARRHREDAAATRNTLKGLVGRTFKALFRHPVVTAAVLLVTVAYGWQAAVGALIPQYDWDGLLYHYTGPDYWIQHGRIQTVALDSEAIPWPDVYPLNVEMIMGWPGGFLHTMRYSTVAQLPMFLLGALSVAGMARRLGAKRPHAAFAGGLFLILPAVVLQASTGYIDVSAASLALAALYLATGMTAAVRERKQIFAPAVRYMTLTGIATGLAVGAKSPNLLIVPIILVTLVIGIYQVWDEGNRPWQVMAQADGEARPFAAGAETPAATHVPDKKEKTRLKAVERRRKWALNPDRVTLVTLGAFLAPIIVVGSFWYLRTWAHYDNPFYPFSMFGFEGRGSVYDVVIKGQEPPELRDRPWGVIGQLSWSWIQDFNVGRTLIYDLRVGGYGLTWLLLVLPAAVYTVVRWVRSKRVGPLPVYLVTAIAVVAASPAAWWPRFTLLLPAIVYALAAVALSALPQRLAPLTVQAVTVGLAAVSLWTAMNPTPLRDETGQRLGITKVAQILGDSEKRNSLWPWFGFKGLNKVPDGSTVGVVDDNSQPFTHPFVGPDVERKLEFVRTPSSLDELREEIEKKDVDYLVISPTGPAQPVALAAKNNKQLFELVSHSEYDMYGAYLLKVVDRPERCKTPGVVLKIEDKGHEDGRVKLTAKAEDDCGKALERLPVALHEYNVVTQHSVILETDKTNEKGEIEFSVPEEDGQRFYFVRYGGTLNQDAGASSILLVEKQ